MSYSRLTCSLEGRPGNLAIIKKGFAFSCSTFEIKIRWRDVKNMSTDTKWLNGKTVATFKVELLKDQAPKAIESTSKENNNKSNGIISARRTFQLSDFNDFISASDNLMRSWKSYKKRKALIAEEQVGSAAQEADEKKATNDANNGVGNDVKGFFDPATIQEIVKQVSTVAGKCLNPVKEASAAVLNFILGLNILYLVFLFIVVVVLLIGLIPGGSKGPLTQTQALFDELDRVRVDLHAFHHNNIKDYSSDSRKRQILGDSAMWVDKLQRSAEELSSAYVFLQLRLSELRQQRANRLFNSDEVTGPVTSSRVFVAPGSPLRRRSHNSAYTLSEWGSVQSVKRRGGSGKSFFVVDAFYGLVDLAHRITTPLRRLAPRHLHRHSLRYLSGERSQSRGGGPRRYEEQYGKNVLSQMVMPEDEEERHECLNLIAELVQVAELTEEVFSQFMAVLMNHVLDDLFTGHYAPHHWSSVPPGVMSGGGTAHHSEESLRELEKSFMDAELALKVIWLRRHLDSLMRQDPLETNDSRRRSESIEFTKHRQEFIALENYLSRWTTANESMKEKLLTHFYKRIVLRDGDDRKGALRNIIDELLFWNSHEELWLEHVTHTLSTKGSSGSGSGFHVLPRSAYPLHWEDLPLFRGLLCFSDTPRLFRGGVDVAQEGVDDKGGQKRDAGKSAAAERESSMDDFFRLLHVEVTAFQQLNEGVMERWINELELFLEAVKDTSSRSRRLGVVTPHFSNATNLEVRHRLLRILKKCVRKNTISWLLSFFWSSSKNEMDYIRSMGAADPALQTVYASTIGIAWDNMIDMPYAILNYVLLQPPELLDLQARTLSLFHWTLGGIVLSLIAVVAAKQLL